MGVQRSVCEPMHHLDYVPVLDPVDRLLHRQVLPVRPLDDPPVVDVLVGVAGDLLLVGGPAPVRVPDRIDVLVAVEPAGLPVGVPEGHLGAVRDHPRLAPDDAPQPALQARLELRAHEGVVRPGLGQQGEVEGEEAEVEEGGEHRHCRHPRREVGQQLAIRQGLVGQKAPEVLEEEKGDEEAGVDADVLHAEGRTSQQAGEAEPGAPARGEGVEGEAAELEDGQQGGQPQEHHHRLHQDEPRLRQHRRVKHHHEAGERPSVGAEAELQDDQVDGGRE